MSLTREDMLRELELLPMWVQHEEIVLPIKAQPEQQAPASNPLDLAPIADMAVEEPTLASIPEPLVANTVDAPRIDIAWLLYCPALSAQGEECRQLLTNIIKAMQLLPTQYTLVEQAQDLTRYHAQKTLLFGLDAINQLLASQHQNLDLLRGQAHVHHAGLCWVTYHPMQLLKDPSLKRGAWQDICAALTYVS
jgi:uracil-DNA glycosylase